MGYGSNYDGFEGGIERPRRRTPNRLDAAQRALAVAAERVEYLASLPQEPTTDDPDGALVVWFERKFNQGGRLYTYAAVKAGDGLWYTTGPRSPKGYTWDALMEWLDDDLTSTIWVAAGWEPLA